MIHTTASPQPAPPEDSPQSLEDATRRNVALIRELDGAAAANAGMADRAAGLVAGWCGRIGFVWLHVAWFTAWIACNTLPRLPHFDPYPFTFLILVVSLEAIFLATFVLMAQNHEMRIAERRNQLDLQINLLTQQQNTRVLQLLDRIGERVGVEHHDPCLRAFQEAMQPEKLVEQIEQANSAEQQGK